MRRLDCTWVVGVLVVCAAFAGAATWTEDFAQSDGPPEGWTVVTESVMVQSEQLVLSATATGAEVAAVAGDAYGPVWFDTVTHIEFDIDYPGETIAWPFDHGGVVFCGQTPVGRYNGNSCYVIDFLARDGNAQTPGRFRLGKFVNGAEGGLTETAQTVETYAGKWEIDLTPTDITFTFNGVQQFTFADSSYRGGYLAFWAFGSPLENMVTIDNISVDVTPDACPKFLVDKLNLTTGKGNSLAPLQIPFGANDTAPYTVTVTSTSPATASPVNSPLTYAAGASRVQYVEVKSTAGGEAKLSVQVAGQDCSGVSLPVEVLGLFAYAEDFAQADGSPEGWYIAAESAQVIGEELMLSRGAADPFVWYAVQGVPVQVGKMEAVRCRVRFARTTDTADLGVGVHGGLVLAPAVTAARGNGYMIDVIERVSDNGFRIYKNNVATIQLGNGGVREPYVWDDLWHDWEIVFTPTGFTFKVDGGDEPGEANVTVDDLSYRGGYLSFWCYTGSNLAPQGQEMWVDDISIEFGSSVCSSITPAAANNRPVNSRTVFTVTAPFGANFSADYSLTVTSTQPAVAVPEGAVGGSLVLSFPQGTPLVQTFEAVCLSPGTTEFQVTAAGVTCPNAKATFTVREPGLGQFCEGFDQADGPPEQWTQVFGTWQVAGGKLTTTCAPGENARGETWLWLGNPTPSVVETDKIGVTINLSQTTPDAVGAHGGMMFFAAAPTNRWVTSGYEIDWIDRVEDHGYRFLRSDNGVHTVLAGPTFDTYQLGARWRVETEDENIRFYVDDELIFDVVDGTYREGYLALWTYCNTTVGEYDDVSIGECSGMLPPTASFTAAPLSGGAPLDVSFDASASTDNGTIASYAWSFGDTTNGSGVTTTHTYTAAGVYTVTLTVTDNDGLTGTASTTITVTQGGTTFKRGDTNADGRTNIADAICLLGYLFGPSTDPCKASVPRCRDGADANNDGNMNIADAIKVLGYLFNFAQTGNLPEPFLACGTDPADPPDSLDCVTYTPCAK